MSSSQNIKFGVDAVEYVLYVGCLTTISCNKKVLISQGTHNIDFKIFLSISLSIFTNNNHQTVFSDSTLRE